MATATQATNRQILVGRLQEASVDVEILGYVVFWNLRGVDVTQDQFATMLKDCGLPEKYAREHNYRSAFTRALRNMEEKRIIRRVSETEDLLIVQFTAEELVKFGGDHLQYDQETLIHVDKKIYRKTKDFGAALTQGKVEIKAKILEYFEREKIRYNSSDMTRYIQNILGDKADLVSLRQNGSIYFVPVGYQATMEQVIALVNGFGGGSIMEYFPIPNVKSSRTTIKNAFVDEVDSLLARMDKEVEAVEGGEKKVTDVWSVTKLNKIRSILERVENYNTILTADDNKRFQDGFTALEKRVSGGRKLVV